MTENDRVDESNHRKDVAISQVSEGVRQMVKEKDG